MSTRSGLVFVVLSVGLIMGCGGENPAPTKTPEATRSTASTPSLSPATPSSLAEVETVARTFLTAAQAGSPDVTRITPAFKKLVGPADKPEGYSDWAVEQWVKDLLMGQANPTPLTATSVSPDLALVQAGSVRLRLTNSPSGWLVDWIHLAPRPNPYPFSGAGFTVHAFLDTLTQGQFALAESYMTPALKAKLAPPLNDPLGYNRGMLQIQLTSLRGSATEWKASGPEPLITVQLIGPGTPDRTFQLKLVPGPSAGLWQVEALDRK